MGVLGSAIVKEAVATIDPPSLVVPVRPAPTTPGPTKTFKLLPMSDILTAMSPLSPVYSSSPEDLIRAKSILVEAGACELSSRLPTSDSRIEFSLSGYSFSVGEMVAVAMSISEEVLVEWVNGGGEKLNSRRPGLFGPRLPFGMTIAGLPSGLGCDSEKDAAGGRYVTCCKGES